MPGPLQLCVLPLEMPSAAEEMAERACQPPGELLQGGFPGCSHFSLNPTHEQRDGWDLQVSSLMECGWFMGNMDCSSRELFRCRMSSKT